jgi:hypothetical protein
MAVTTLVAFQSETTPNDSPPTTIIEYPKGTPIVAIGYLNVDPVNINDTGVAVFDKRIGMWTQDTYAPIVVGPVYIKTYSTPTRTIPAPTAVAPATTGSALSSYGFTQAQADAISLAVAALVADSLANRQLIAAMVTDLEAAGILG